MKNQNLILIFLCVFPQLVSANTSYVVQGGDTILKIADRSLGIENNRSDPRRYQFAREIIANNPSLKNPNQLTPGQTLIIPGGGESASAPTPIAAETPQMSENPVLMPPPPAMNTAQIVPQYPLESPAAPPAPAVEHPPIHQTHASTANQSYLFIQPRFTVDEFKTKDIAAKKEIKTKSALNTGLNLGYGFAVGHSGHLIVEGGANYSQLAKPSASDITLSNKVMWMKNFGLGYERALTPSVHVHAMALMSDYLVVIPTETAYDYTVDTVTMPAADLTLGWHFLHLSSSTFGISASGEYVFDAKKNGVKYKTGFEPAGTLSWETHRPHGLTNYRVALRYQPSAQKSDAIDQHGTHYGLRFTVLFPM